MDGFFSGTPLRPVVDLSDESIDRFAQAIAGRFNNPDRPLLTARLSATISDADATRSRHVTNDDSTFSSSPTQAPSLSLSRMSKVFMTSRFPSSSSNTAPTSSSPMLASDFTVVTASTLPGLLQTTHLLVLDIRPHSAYATSRLPHAISLSVPSTLLKRPAFTLQKLATMLSSASARSRFSAWRMANRILVYDADSSALHDGSNLLGLFRKFRAEGYKGDIAWLQGGIQALWRENRQLLDESSVSDEEEDAETPRFIRAKDLPLSAFQQSTTTAAHSQSQPLVLSSTAPTSRGLPLVSPSRLPANPFFDNIRQNIELSQGVVDRIPLQLSPSVISRAQHLPFAWLRDIVATAGKDEGAEALAMQFYRIELGEQRRMQGVMAHHSRQSGPVAVDSLKSSECMSDSTERNRQEDTLFPYSILAGVEKGTKNRYRNIWPFEHSRVRLRRHEDDDYINASFVRPLGTRRQYIATQGPLPSTYADFWSIVWEQNVKVIVMLTRVTEGGNVKCGKYWFDGQYGPYALKCVSVSGAVDEDEQRNGGFFDSSSPHAQPEPQAGSADEHNHTIRRIFELSNVTDRAAKPHIITHLQYLDWPDMDVPAKPKGLLQLMSEVDELADRTNTHSTSPILMHCSAGVGRTGAFIMIDAILDGIRRELCKEIERRRADLAAEDETSTNNSECQGGSTDAMDIDCGAGRKKFTSGASSEMVPADSENSRSINPSEDVQHSDISQIEIGPVATLHLTGDNSRRLDIHVPLVPSSSSPTQLQTPRAFQLPELANSPIREHSSHQNPKYISGMTSSTQASAIARQRPGIYARRVLHPDFTIADADSMFTNPNPNPLFAMDVESMPSGPQQLAGSSSSGEGNSSGKDGASSGSGSAVGSGSSSGSGRVGPLQMAFANMSSADDVQGPFVRGSDSDISQTLLSRVQVSNGSGSGSSSEMGANASGSSQSSGRSGAADGYSSTSSLGLRGFANMGVSSPPSSLSISSSSSGAIHGPRFQPRKKTSILAPKPIHPLSAPVAEIIEGGETNVTATDASAARSKSNKHFSSSSHSMLSSSSSLRSLSSFSSRLVSSHTTDTLATSASVHNISRPFSPSADKSKDNESSLESLIFTKDAFDYTSPRRSDNGYSPPLLSTFDEPIRQILEDMREQRMSLCQSLRQYVFVHKAILEGALLIVAQERERVSSEESESPDDDSSLVKMTGKRGASPTELLKEDKKGDVALAKRPSVKRGKSTSSGGESTGSA